MADVRAGRASDLPELTAIYNHYVRETHATFDIAELTVDERGAWLAQYADTGPHRLLVAVEGDVLLGYATSSRLRAKPAYDASVETTVYLRADETGRGLGSLLYDALLAALADEGVHLATAAVALPNDASIALHRRHGFHEVGVFHEVGLKFGRWRDVQWFERVLG